MCCCDNGRERCRSEGQRARSTLQLGHRVYIFREAGLPPGVLNVIAHSTADAAEVTSTLIQHPAIKKINFTGSTRVGRIIAREAGQYPKPVLLELGGKASCIVMEDADLEDAAKACVTGALLHVSCTESVKPVC